MLLFSLVVALFLECWMLFHYSGFRKFEEDIKTFRRDTPVTQETNVLAVKAILFFVGSLLYLLAMILMLFNPLTAWPGLGLLGLSLIAIAFMKSKYRTVWHYIDSPLSIGCIVWAIVVLVI